jgi:hypothetical protein
MRRNTGKPSKTDNGKERQPMAEKERTRERERATLEENTYERSMRARKEWTERGLNGPVVVTEDDREWFQARQGKLFYYLCPVSHKETPLNHWRVFMHDIKTVSGKHRHQGGLLIYVLEGVGYSIVNGERKDWKKGDLVLLPMVPGGVEHQHFNLAPEKGAARWIAFINMPIHEHVASDLQQVENSPDFR